MGCEHKRLQSVNCVISCLDCGEVLPADFLTKKAEAAEAPAQEAPKKRTRKGAK